MTLALRPLLFGIACALSSWRRLLHHRRRLERVVRRRRRQRPLERSAPSHGLAGRLRAAADALDHRCSRKSSCDRPKPNAPIVEIMLKSANCSA